MLYNQIFYNVLKILAENGETRTVTLLKLTKTNINSMFVPEPLVFDHLMEEVNACFEITLPHELVDMDSFIMDWGDDEKNKETKHRYIKSGNYRVKMYDKKINHILISPKSASGIQNFITIGRIGITSLSFLFYGSIFDGVIGPNWDTSNIVSTRGMFYSNPKFNKKFGLNWDTTNIIDMSYMFSETYGFNQMVGHKWDISKVTNMTCMFWYATKFSQPIMKYWNIPETTDTTNMFYGTNIRNV